MAQEEAKIRVTLDTDAIRASMDDLQAKIAAAATAPETTAPETSAADPTHLKRPAGKRSADLLAMASNLVATIASTPALAERLLPVFIERLLPRIVERTVSAIATGTRAADFWATLTDLKIPGTDLSLKDFTRAARQTAERGETALEALRGTVRELQAMAGAAARVGYMPPSGELKEIAGFVNEYQTEEIRRRKEIAAYQRDRMVRYWRSESLDFFGTP